MGWFDEQIRQRKENEEAFLSEAVHNMVGAVTGEKPFLNNKDDMRAMRMNIRRLQEFLQGKNSNANDLSNRYIDTVNTLAGKNDKIFEALQDNSDLISKDSDSHKEDSEKTPITFKF